MDKLRDEKEFEELHKKLVSKIIFILFKYRSIEEYGFARDSLEVLSGENFLPKYERSLGGIRLYMKNPDYFVTIRHRRLDFFDVYVSERKRNKISDLVNQRCRYNDLPKVVRGGLDKVLNKMRYL